MIKFSTQREDSHVDPMITWLINRQCNFRCQYCFSHSYKEQVQHSACSRYSPEHIAACFERISKNCWIYITGGEPFLCSRFIEICSALTQNNCISINTNLSTPNVAEFAERIDPEHIYSINASLHIMEREKQRDGVTRFIQNVHRFQKKGIQIRVEYVVYPPLFNRIEKDMAFLAKEGVEIVNLKVFRGFYKSKHYPFAYTDEERAFIKSNALDHTEIDFMDKKFSFFGRYCRAGIDFFILNPDGSVRRCSTSERAVGNFFSSQFSILDHIQPCVFNRCACTYEGIRFAQEEKAHRMQVLSEMSTELPVWVSKKLTPSRLWRFVNKKIGFARSEQ